MTRYWDDDDDTPPKHRACACGCGELADECMRGSFPLAAFVITTPDPNPYAVDNDHGRA